MKGTNMSNITADIATDVIELIEQHPLMSELFKLYKEQLKELTNDVLDVDQININGQSTSDEDMDLFYFKRQCVTDVLVHALTITSRIV